jgi:SAM-dependent methyltransferase
VRKNYFDEPVASRYDDPDDAMFDPAVTSMTAEFLAGIAGGGAALEFGIGTGRIALPLAGRGIAVHGIDLSEAMVARLRAKPGGEHIGVTIGDFATARVDRQFQLAYLVYNTIENLTSQDDQVDCFRNAAAHLVPGGCFVIEVGIPSLQRLPVGERYVPFTVTDRHLGFDEYDVVNQGLVSHHYTFTPDGKTTVAATPFRYVWPAELDLMARIAGMRLKDRWADWDRSPFTAESTKHVSVWDKRLPHVPHRLGRHEHAAPPVGHVRCIGRATSRHAQRPGPPNSRPVAASVGLPPPGSVNFTPEFVPFCPPPDLPNPVEVPTGGRLVPGKLNSVPAFARICLSLDLPFPGGMAHANERAAACPAIA